LLSVKSDNSLIFNRLRKLNTAHRILMTGTPLNNNIRELFNLLNFLDPTEFRWVFGVHLLASGLPCFSAQSSRALRKGTAGIDNTIAVIVVVVAIASRAGGLAWPLTRHSELTGLEKKYEQDNLTEDLVKELHDMVRPYILRRIKSEVLKLPPKVSESGRYCDGVMWCGVVWSRGWSGLRCGEVR
jgi:SNF2 family DNA or RNA helicase